MTLAGLPMWVIGVALFCLGAWAARFLNVCIERFPKTESLPEQLRLLKPQQRWWELGRNRSPWLEYLPVIGWLFVNRRSAGQVPWRYPLLELFNGALFILAYWLEIPQGAGATLQQSIVHTELGPGGLPGCWLLNLTGMLHLRLLYHLFLFECLIVATCIDWEQTIIPDGCTVPGMVVGLLGSLLGQLWLVPVWFQEPSINLMFQDGPEWFKRLLLEDRVPGWISQHPHWHGLAVSVAGFLVGGGVIWGLRLIGNRLLRQEAMGFGDVTLMAMIGSFLGWQPVLMVFFIAPALAIGWTMLSVLARFRFSRSLPYGPFLSAATVIVVLAWQKVWPVGLHFFSWGPLIVPVAAVLTALLVCCLIITQGVKWLLGIPLYPPDEFQPEVWEPADQHFYLAGEQNDPWQGRWRNSQWEGEQSGRGQQQQHHWQRGTNQTRYQYWQRHR